jgi:cation:H+ antiporter
LAFNWRSTDKQIFETLLLKIFILYTTMVDTILINASKKKMILTEAVLLSIGILLLVKGSDFFVRSAVSIAKELGVSEFVIGLTLVAVGTSIPEVGASIAASIKHQSGIVIGNVLGSNIANINLIIGIIAVLWVLKTDRQMLERDGYIMLFAALLFYLFMLNGVISRIEGLVFLLLYGAYVIFIVETRSKRDQVYNFKDFVIYFFQFRYLRTTGKTFSQNNDARKKDTGHGLRLTRPLAKNLITVVVSTGVIWYGANLLVEAALFFADLFHLPKTVIGLSLIALGTSLPELGVTLAAAKKGLGNIVVGNIIGSNIVNIFLIIGISSIISPLAITQATMLTAAPFMIAMTVLFLVFIRSRWQLERIEAILFLLLYGVFLGYIFFSNSGAM